MIGQYMQCVHLTYSESILDLPVLAGETGQLVGSPVRAQRFRHGAHLGIGIVALENRRWHPRAGAVRRHRAPSPPVGLGRRGPPSTTSAWAVFGSPSAPDDFKHTKRNTVPESSESVPP